MADLNETTYSAETFTQRTWPLTENFSLANNTDLFSEPRKLKLIFSCFVPILFFLGVIGNCLTIRVMMSHGYRNMPVSKLLMALSFSDMMVNALILFNQTSARELFGKDLLALSTAGCRLYFWAYRYSRLTSSWMVVLISCERFVAVWFHLKAKTINSTRNAYLAVTVVYGLFAVYVGYLCSWSDRVVNGRCLINSFTSQLEHRARGFMAVSLIAYNVLPSLILLLVNTLIVYKLIRMSTARSRVGVTTSSHGQARVNVRSARNSKTTVMLLTVTISFIVLVTPNAATHLVSFIKKDAVFGSSDRTTLILRELSAFCEQLDHSINFLLYVISSKTFRDGLVALFKRSRSPAAATHSTTAD